MMSSSTQKMFVKRALIDIEEIHKNAKSPIYLI